MKKKLAIDDILLMDTELAVKWNDDEQSFIALRVLRDHCPCAFCSGEKDAFGNVYKGPTKELGVKAYQAHYVEKVGHYALQIFWDDHHADGLYTYEMVRKLGERCED